MENKNKIIVSLILFGTGVILSANMMVSKTEQFISLIYVLSIIGTVWNWSLYKYQYLIASITISFAVLLFVIGLPDIRYIHYLDKLSNWTYYFFITGVLFSFIDLLKNKQKH